MEYYLAVDIGASGGRHILSHVEKGRIVLEEVYRFKNSMYLKNNHLCWDLDTLFENIVQGMRRCAALGKFPLSMGIDTWAVDFVLLSKNGKLIGDSVAYRDARTEGMDKLVEEKIPAEELYQRTGIQKQNFNTIYQLEAIKNTHPEYLEQAEFFLMLPDYFNYRLTGIMKTEYTNATSTGLVNAQTKTWDKEIIRRLGYPEKLFQKLYLPKNFVGRLSKEIQNEVGFNCTVILPATHDTGSAFLAVPAMDEQSVYISSGTWSLLGVENKNPITTEQSRAFNFTNEGGYDFRFRYLKNIMGLWMIQSIQRETPGNLSFSDLEQLARDSESFSSTIDVNDACFLAPKNMEKAVKDYCKKTGQAIPSKLGETLQCVYRSLALSYADALHQLEKMTGKTYTSINIVGGGSKDTYLNLLTSRATGVPVYSGPTEATALGNLLVQMLVAGEFRDLNQARETIKSSFNIQKTPANAEFR